MVCKPGDLPKMLEITPTFKEMSSVVGGDLEIINLPDFCIYCRFCENNDTVNRYIAGRPLFGTFFICKKDHLRRPRGIRSKEVAALKRTLWFHQILKDKYLDFHRLDTKKKRKSA